MNTRAIKALLADIEGSKVHTLAQLIGRARHVLEVERQVFRGDRLAARVAMRGAFNLMGWPWGKSQVALFRG